MIKSNHQKLLKRSGFTLIELVIVIGIIIILAGVMIPSFQIGTKKRDFTKNVDTFTEELRATRQKAISGVSMNHPTVLVDPPKLISWGIAPSASCDAYSLIYTFEDTSVTRQTFNFEDGLEIDSAAPGALPCNQQVVNFARFSGFLDPQGTEVDIFLTNGDYDAIININEFGNISLEVQ